MEMIKRGYGLPPLSSAKNEYKKEKKINIIDAKTARKLTETSLSSEALYELEKVNKCIQDAINEGKYNCYYYHYLHDPAVRKLKDIGYKVTNCSTQREGDCFKIEWQVNKISTTIYVPKKIKVGFNNRLEDKKTELTLKEIAARRGV